MSVWDAATRKPDPDPVDIGQTLAVAMDLLYGEPDWSLAIRAWVAGADALLAGRAGLLAFAPPGCRLNAQRIDLRSRLIGQIIAI